MYHNFIFDLYGTLVDIHTNEHKPSLWKKLALSYPFQGAAFFQILFERYGLDPAACLMVGNERTSDLAGAVTAGIDCCYLHTATSSGSAEEAPKEALFTVMDGDSHTLQKLLLNIAASR
mgnify:CR=1 FL=1